jgi:hypothetical protein
MPSPSESPVFALELDRPMAVLEGLGHVAEARRRPTDGGQRPRLTVEAVDLLVQRERRHRNAFGERCNARGRWRCCS